MFPTYEPMAVFNKTFEEWVNKTLEQCILDGKERECHFFDDDIIDHPIVSRKKNPVQLVYWPVICSAKK